MCISQCAFYQVLVPSACSINFPKQMIKPVGLKEHRMHVHMELMPIQCGFLGGTQSSARNGAGTFHMEHPPILVLDTHVHQLFLNFVVVHTQQSHQVWVWVLSPPSRDWSTSALRSSWTSACGMARNSGRSTTTCRAC